MEKIKVGLFLIFNHHYEKNFDKLISIYQDRFTNIFFVVPHYSGTHPKVISVYGNSYFFQGFIAQCYQKTKNQKFDRYIFCADDLYLNPEINENNIDKYFKTNEDTAFIPQIFALNNHKERRPSRPSAPYWPGIKWAVKFKLNNAGNESQKLLPSVDIIREKFIKHGLEPISSIPKRMFLINFSSYFKLKRKLFWYNLKTQLKNIPNLLIENKLQIPLVGGYSDLVIMPYQNISDFSKFCGIFSSLNLFVELAIPTAAILSCEKIESETSIGITGKTYWFYDNDELNKLYSKSLSELRTNFPRKHLYIHPVKVSQWNE